MADLSYITFAIIILNVFASYRGLNDREYFEKYLFEVDKILIHKEYVRLFTSGFLHVDWMHLFLNMFALYAFSHTLVHFVGWIFFLVIYIAGLIGGNLLALYIYRNNGSYRAVGASGAVCAIIFASIALFPGIKVSLFLIPIGIPGWVFGVLYIVATIYGIQNRSGNIGHEAHFGGAVIGLLVSAMIYPKALADNYLPFVLILIPSLIFLFLIFRNPSFLLVGFSPKTKPTRDEEYNERRKAHQDEVDRILDKISSKGLHSLTEEERKILEAYSKKSGGRRSD